MATFDRIDGLLGSISEMLKECLGILKEQSRIIDELFQLASKKAKNQSCLKNDEVSNFKYPLALLIPTDRGSRLIFDS
jgi:hypothetical protein